MLGKCRSSKVGKDITQSFTLAAAMMLFVISMCFLFNPKCGSNFFLDIALTSYNPVSPVFSLDKSVVVISTYVLTSFCILSHFFLLSVGSDVARCILRIEDRHANLAWVSCCTCIIATHPLSEKDKDNEGTEKREKMRPRRGNTSWHILPQCSVEIIWFFSTLYFFWMYYVFYFNFSLKKRKFEYYTRCLNNNF